MALMAKKTDPNLVWIDLEMSGLDPDRNVILEIATSKTAMLRFSSQAA